ncbi:hypothetical protein [Actinomadura madurae]|uniref:hypothetical protein n=1 Tax=Actinomadura madurae TaxID=1993 RepID=UPI0020269B00|nr:hypothetical protein [Actinomadura madurae]MCP9951600.1 hypothetical protein [Actinomadura madurae]MCP9980843.1 hypothetical protein [Actinomadura madurae]MCQ0007660.1 hypothetical protein [Actinomadura madurae]URM97337.1 hypothetical protein LUW76_24945 [Actinomadura madurae]
MTLNARLLTGLLAVTTAGLAIMGLVSALVLNGYLMHRVDGELLASREYAVARLLRPGFHQQGVAPAQFVVLAVGTQGSVRVLSGDEPSPERAVAEVQRLGTGGLAARAERGSRSPCRGCGRWRARGGAASSSWRPPSTTSTRPCATSSCPRSPRPPSCSRPWSCSAGG